MKRLLAAFLLAGCATPPAATFVLGADGRADVTIRLAPTVQAAARAWHGADVFAYDVNLLVEQEGAFVDPPASLTAVVLPANPRAVFTGLAPGRYEAHVTARGNQGGTAADTVLNATKPAVVAFTLGESPTVAVALDDVPFSATVRLPGTADLPKWATKVDAKLIAGARTIPLTYTPAQGGHFANVRGDVHYQLSLAVYSPTGKTTVTIPDFVIPRQDGLETVVTPVFPTPDPPTGTLLNTYAVPGGAFAVAVDGADHLWVANNKGNTATKLDLAGHVLATLGVGTKPSGVAVDRADGTVWVTNLNSSTVSKIVNDAVVATYATGGFSFPGGVAVDADHTAWIGLAFAGAVAALKPDGQSLPGAPFATGGGTAAVAIDPTNGTVWAVNKDDNSYSRIAGGVVTKYLMANGPAGLAIAPDRTIWIASTTDGVLHRLNSDGSQAGVTQLISGTSAVAVDPTSGAAWVGAQAINGVSKVNANGTLVGHFPAATFPAGVAIDAHHHVWVVGNIGVQGFVSELAP
ncbi:MAG: hypothetical protein JWM80_4599 [Cyanobacteria bacterium RYN_339]|nr:hypothetical protein [Cyanobacteria bacterium RYN_339]